LRNKLSTIFLTILLFTACGDHLAATDPGATGFSFLKVSWGARNAGMGDVGVALPSGLSGSHINPASLSAAEAMSFNFMHQEYIFDTRREFVGTAIPTILGNFSAGIDFFKVDDIEYREGASVEPIGMFDAQEYSIFVGYAGGLGDKLSIGLMGKYVAEKIESETADAIAFDAGATWKYNQSLSFGAAVKNVGSKPKFLADEVDLPTTVSVGLGLSVYDMQVGGDVSFPRNDDLRVNFGAERYLADFLALRAGYRIGYDEEDISFGVGFSQSIWQVDYAFVPYGSGLGSSHRFALTVYWR
jgi:hypothetical protein